MVELGDMLTQVWREEKIDASRDYRLLGVRWYGEGLFEKESKLGHEIRANSLYRVETGDFVYNRLFAWKGSFALVTDDVDGAYVSNEFPCFITDNNRLDVKFLWMFFRKQNAWTQALSLSSGATPTSRNRLKEKLFLKIKIPLPSLDEQRRLVARIEELVAEINEAKKLRKETILEVEALCQAILTSDREAKLTAMRDLVKLRKPDIVVQPQGSYQFAGVYSFGRGVFRGQSRTGMEFAYPRLTTLRTGNFVYPKLMAWEGALGIVPPECNGCVVSTEFPVFEVNEKLVLPDVLDTYFRMPTVWPDISGASTGTNVRRRRLNPNDFLNYRIPLPTIATQKKLREVKVEVEILKRLQSETQAELDAMLPSILDRAFKGEI